MTETFTDEALIDHLQSAAFDYFLMRCNCLNGLIPDTSREGSPASVAGIGFALASYPAAVERGWMTRAEAVKRTLATMQFFWHGPPGATFETIGHRGFCYHFLDIKSGKRAWKCELSFIDTALLIAGMFVVATYFSKQADGESEIRDLVDKFYRRVEWDWALNGGKDEALSWKPGEGFSPWRWDGYSEGLILYILGLGSPTHPLVPADYQKWESNYQWRNLYDIEYLHGGPLFMHHFSHAFIDFRGIRDDFMRIHNLDYFENSRRATLIQQQYAIENPHSFIGYGKNCWGLSAGDGPSNCKVKAHGKVYQALGYAARGVPDGPDDGTLMPSATLASLPFTPELSVNAIRHIQQKYPELIKHQHIPSAFNPSLPDKKSGIWISDGYYALDQGIIMLMLENHRTGLIWSIMRDNKFIKEGLRKAGFEGGWLNSAK
jgi:hypothetical protein